MSQTAYLTLAFAAVVVTLVAWAAIMLAKFSRLRREVTDLHADG